MGPGPWDIRQAAGPGRHIHICVFPGNGSRERDLQRLLNLLNLPNLHELHIWVVWDWKAR